MTWDDIVAIGLALPGVEVGTSYGTPALKVRGQMLATMGKPPMHFVLSATLDEVDVLMLTEPDVFFQTPHYVGWPAVLVRYQSADPERVAILIERAWERRAPASLRKLRV